MRIPSVVFAGPFLFAAIALCGVNPVFAQPTSQDLENAIDLGTRFNLDTNGPSPRLVALVTGTNPGASFRVAAMEVRNEMVTIGWGPGDGEVTAQPGGVELVWIGESHTISQDDTILLCTALDGVPGADIIAQVTGNNSTAYAVAGNGDHPTSAADGGDATAIDSGTAAGHAEAWGGVGVNNGNGGSADADSVEGSATGIAGSGDAGGAAVATAELDAYAAGGGGSSNAGGDADATSASGNAFAEGGDSIDDGGRAYAEASNIANAAGGNSVNGNGGEAESHSVNDQAMAAGGNSDAGNGGDAIAGSQANPSFEAYAFGGFSLGGNGPGNGGRADAWGVNIAEATGGEADDTGTGGVAVATSTTGTADAEGGASEDGDAGNAGADGPAGATAVGGVASGTGDGGGTLATSAAGGASATAGDSNGGGNGGSATATADLDASAEGGSAVGNGSAGGLLGFSAIATSFSGGATAIGGDVEHGFPTFVRAFGYDSATAIGGNAATLGGTNTIGGSASAWVTSVGTLAGAYAQGGHGDTGGNASADCDFFGPSGGHAEAVAGNGAIGNGGNAAAVSTGVFGVNRGSARATSGNGGSGGGVTGGTAAATGSTGFAFFLPTGSSGGTVFVP